MRPKILTFDDTLSFIKTEKALGRKTVFTNGCFDLLHRGHVEYLQFARAQGDLLIVGVNSDESVRALKGSSRPLNALEDRLLVLAALEAVTCVVPFHTLTPESLVATLQPDVFVKGGDYTINRLPEAQIVQSYGGAVVLAPMIPGRSTTNLIDRMGGNLLRQAIFLDRDGTIIQDEHYLRDPARVRLLAHAAEGMQLMQAMGFDLFLVTNQSGVARGYMTVQDVHAVNDELQRQLRQRGVHFRDVRYCPHLQGCSCRKPQPGMLLDLASRHGIDLTRSVMIGDKHTDVQAGLNAGCHSLMVGTPGNDDLLSIAKRLQSEEVLS